MWITGERYGRHGEEQREWNRVRAWVQTKAEQHGVVAELSKKVSTIEVAKADPRYKRYLPF